MYLLPNIRLAHSILKRKFLSADKPHQKLAPQKGPSKNIRPGAYFRNFTVVTQNILTSKLKFEGGIWISMWWPRLINEWTTIVDILLLFINSFPVGLSDHLRKALRILSNLYISIFFLLEAFLIFVNII